MRRIIVSEFLSIDGIMEAPEWMHAYITEEQNHYKFDELKSCGALLLGRVTYQGFAAAWPKITDQAPNRTALPDGFSFRMNHYPKYVVSSTLREVKWQNSSLIRGNVVEEIKKLKEQTGEDILVCGSSELVNLLLRHDLVDELRLMVFPVVLGRGKRLFQDDLPKSVLQPVDTKTFDSGVTVLTYRR